MDELLQTLEKCIELVKAIPDASLSPVFRWRVYEFLQAQKGDLANTAAIYKELNCSIHLGLMGEMGAPVTLPCGHTYCRDCLEGVMARKCPDCRADIPYITLHNNVAIKSIVDRLMPRH